MHSGGSRVHTHARVCVLLRSIRTLNKSEKINELLERIPLKIIEFSTYAFPISVNLCWWKNWKWPDCWKRTNALLFEIPSLYKKRSRSVIKCVVRGIERLFSWTSSHFVPCEIRRPRRKRRTDRTRSDLLPDGVRCARFNDGFLSFPNDRHTACKRRLKTFYDSRCTRGAIGDGR